MKKYLCWFGRIQHIPKQQQYARCPSNCCVIAYDKKVWNSLPWYRQWRGMMTIHTLVGSTTDGFDLILLARTPTSEMEYNDSMASSMCSSTPYSKILPKSFVEWPGHMLCRVQQNKRRHFWYPPNTTRNLVMEWDFSDHSLVCGAATRTNTALDDGHPFLQGTWHTLCQES